MNTSQKFARCLASTGHRYGETRISRDYIGHRVWLRLCERCGVPERPKLHNPSVGRTRPRDVILSYRDD